MQLNIEPSDIMPALLNQRRVEEGDPEGPIELVCETVLIARMERDGELWRTTHLACDHPCHGPHPRYRKLYEKLRGEFGPLLPGTTPPEECPKCAGEVWLPADTDVARQQFIMNTTMQMCRGIPLAGDGYDSSQLNPEHVRATIATFLSGGEPAPVVASDSPAGVAPGRAP